MNTGQHFIEHHVFKALLVFNFSLRWLLLHLYVLETTLLVSTSVQSVLNKPATMLVSSAF